MQDWLVIQIRPRWEKKVARLLDDKGIQTFFPLIKERHQWSDRVKVIEKPLLGSFCFVKIREEQRTDVRLTPGVVNFVYRKGKPVLVKEKLIGSIREFQQLHPEIRVLEKILLEKETTAGSPMNGKDGKTAILPLKVLDITLVALTGPQYATQQQ